MSNVYAMLDFTKEIEEYKSTFSRVSELSKELGSVEQQLDVANENDRADREITSSLGNWYKYQEVAERASLKHYGQL